MNPLHNSNQNQLAVQQVNSAVNQQMCNGNTGGLFPNNRQTPSSFTTYPIQPFPMQNTMGQFPNGIGGFNSQQNFNPFPVNQFNPSQQHGQFFAHNSMNPTAFSQNVGLPNEQVIMQNTIQNICQLLQLQNPNYAQFVHGNFPMSQNQIANVMGLQNPGFVANQQFGRSNTNGPVQHANQGQQRFGSPMLDVNASGSVQTQQSRNVLHTLTNFQNQIAHGTGPQDPSFLANQPFGTAHSNGPVQHVNQGQQRFVSPLMDVNALKQSTNTAQQLQGSSFLPHASGSVQTQQAQKDNHGNVHANVNAEWAASQHKNFAGRKRSDASHKGFKSQFHHAKEKLRVNNGNMNKRCNYNSAANSVPPSSIKKIHVEKRVPVLNYTEQEIKQWREARKKHYPTKANTEKKPQEKQTLTEVANEEANLRCQQLKQILAKQAELGCEVAEIPSSYLYDSGNHCPGENKQKRERDRKGNSRNKRRKPHQNDRTAKKTRPGDQDSFKANHQTNGSNPNKKEPSLLQKLLMRDVKRDKTHLLQVFRFAVANSFFNGEHDKFLTFPSVIVRETSLGVAEDTSSLAFEGGKKVVEIHNVDCDEGETLREEREEEEEGEITD